jgi:hypothetical protein
LEIGEQVEQERIELEEQLQAEIDEQERQVKTLQTQIGVLAREAKSHYEVVDKFRNVVRERETEVAQLKDEVAMLAVRGRELMYADDDGEGVSSDYDSACESNDNDVDEQQQDKESVVVVSGEIANDYIAVDDAIPTSKPTATSPVRTAKSTRAPRTGARTGGGRSRVGGTGTKESARAAELTTRMTGLQLERDLLASDLQGLELKAEWLSQGVFGLAHGGVPSTLTTVFEASSLSDRLGLLLDTCTNSSNRGTGSFSRHRAESGQSCVNVCPGLLAANQTIGKVVSLFQVCNTQVLVSVSSLLHGAVKQTDMAARALGAALASSRGGLPSEEAEHHCQVLTESSVAVSDVFDSAMEHLDAEEAVAIGPMLSARKLVTLLQHHRVRLLELNELVATALVILVSTLVSLFNYVDFVWLVGWLAGWLLPLAV